MAKAHWQNTHGFGGGGFNATLRDYAHIEQMMLQGGKINNKQIVPQTWVTESTQYTGSDPVITGTPRGYGYQWWAFLDTEIYEAVGIQAELVN